MTAGRSLKLATLFGIRIGVSASWFVALFILLYFLTERFRASLGLELTPAFGIAAVATALFFGSILLHEIGHAVAAQREGIEVQGIDLFIFGGVMKMSREGSSAWSMFRISAAGPLVTLLIVLAAAAVAIGLLGWSETLQAATLEPGVGATAAEQLVALLLVLNVVLLAFNLLPGLPLDGGQMLRATIWGATGDRLKATRVAAALGQGLSYVLFAGGAYWLFTGDSFDGIWALALGFMIGEGARAARAQAEFSERLEGITVADIMDSEPVTIPAELPAATALDEYFERYQGWDWFAVTEEDGRFAGVAHRAAVRTAAGEGAVVVRDVASTYARDARVAADAPLESLLGSEPLRRLGALMAVGEDGRLRGVVTFEQVTRALRANLA